MARKKQPEPHANHERWLVSYADFITLLFAFFVVMFAASNVNDKKKAEAEKAFVAAFESFGIFPGAGKPNIVNMGGQGTSEGAVDSGGNSDNLAMPAEPNPTPDQSGEAADSDTQNKKPSGKYKNPDESPTATPSPEPNSQPGIGSADSPTVKAVAVELNDLLDNEIKEGRATVKLDKRGIVIGLRDANFVNMDSAELKEPSAAILDQVAARLVALRKPGLAIRVEGHTDNRQIADNTRYRDNLELSTARASTILYRLLAQSFSPSNLVASGYGEWRPSESSVTPEGRAANRRVDIVLLYDEFSRLEPKARLYTPPPIPVTDLMPLSVPTNGANGK